MKKSDIAIYISAVLTLILTTFVVFSTQNVTTYDEKKIDDILKKQDAITNASASGSDSSPLFNTKIRTGDTDDTSKDKKLLLDDTTSTTNKKTDPINSTTIDTKTPVKKKSFADINNLDILSDSKTTTKKHTVAPVRKKRPTTITRRPAVKRPASNHTFQGKTTTVKYGDTMWKIAARYGVTTASVVRANSHLRNPNIIYPGMTIRIP